MLESLLASGRHKGALELSMRSPSTHSQPIVRVRESRRVKSYIL
jgi:hypothetical protein